MTTASMRAVRFHRQGGPEELVCDTVDRPSPAADEVLVRVQVAGVNFSDVVRRRGDPYPQPSPLPFIPGGEAIGIVEAVGARVNQALLGRRVFGFPGKGCYAEYIVVADSHVFPVPDGLEPVAAIALFVQGLSASLILSHAAQLARGETILIQGAAGGVGLIAVQLARILGAGRIIGAASSEAKRQLVSDCGAHLVLDSTAADWMPAVNAFTDGRGVDVVLEMTGGPTARQCLQLLAPFGRCVVYGVASREPLIVNTEHLPGRNLTVTGFYLRPYLQQRALIEQLLDDLAQHVREQRLTLHTGGVFDLAMAAEAHRQLESRRSHGKIALVI